MNTYDDMAGKIAIVSGGGQGIGEACVETLARHGAFVFATGRHIETTSAVINRIKTIGLDGEAFVLDVTKPESIDNLVSYVLQKKGKIDILINNAGMIDRHRVEEVDVKMWDQLINTNLRSIHLLSKACIPSMRSNGGGKIVNVTSLAGRIGGKRTAPSYVASKGGIISMTKSYALQCAEWNIQINGVAPGLIETPMTAGRNSGSDVPCGRLGTPQDIANAVYFLASQYSDYITGCTIDVNGGLYMS